MSKRNLQPSPNASSRERSPRASGVIRLTALAWFALVIGVLLVARSANIPLGQGSFQYRFSPFQGFRTLRAMTIIPIAALVCGAILFATRRRGLALTLATISAIFLCTWTWWVPPQQMIQHSFNLRSPSHEGAFMLEAEQIQSLDSYLRTFDKRIAHSPKEMMGTRVISNPPGTTIAFYAVRRMGVPAWLETLMRDKYGIIERDVSFAARTIEVSVLLCAVWLLSAVFIFLAARQLLPLPGAMLAALIAWFNPSTVHFSPGKDPAQLLFVGLMLWTWLRARQTNSLSGRVALRGAFGVTLAISATVGLVHFWVALAIVLAGAWEDFGIDRSGLAPELVKQLLPAIVGLAVVLIGAEVFIGWNMLATFAAVSSRYVQIQHELQLSRPIWFAIGLPIFLLFTGAGVIVFAALMIRRKRAMNFGARLAIATAGVMLICYLVGVTYELPRLWVVFLPSLSIGLVAATPLAHARHPGKAVRALIFIAVIHLFCTAAHWAQLDVRESEYRLLTNRMFTRAAENSPAIL